MHQSPLNRWELSRALTKLANSSATEIARGAPPPKSSHIARRIGITGAPGAGKSTLVGHLATQRLHKGRLGVLAVDPSSPHSGGAILGDRVRMDDIEGANELYIRSLGSRKTSDGLADNLPEMLELLDAHGFDEVILETVGVGQAEYAVRNQVDTLVLVLLPDSGDAVQAMKAGIMEMADIFVVNKADLPGAQRMVTDLRRIAAVTRNNPGSWVPPILLTTSTQAESIRNLSDAIDQHSAWLSQTDSQRKHVLTQRARYRLKRNLELRIGDLIKNLDEEFFSQSVAEQMLSVLDALRTPLDAQAMEA
ncbi:MAG: GTP-binding protein [Comamonas sp.]